MIQPALLPWRVDVSRVPADGLDVAFTATPEERGVLAAANGLLDLPAFSVTATLRSDGNDGVSVDGRVVAQVVQTCVVTLAAVDQHMDEPFSVRFVLSDSPEARALAKPGAEMAFAWDESDPPEILSHPWIDIGAIAEEHFVLAIDPYPRAPGAALAADSPTEPPAGSDSPFAVLADLPRRRTP